MSAEDPTGLQCTGSVPCEPIPVPAPPSSFRMPPQPGNHYDPEQGSDASATTRSAGDYAAHTPSHPMSANPGSVGVPQRASSSVRSAGSNDANGNTAPDGSTAEQITVWGMNKYSPMNGGWHDYTVRDTVCAAALSCSVSEMGDQDRRFAVPGQNPSLPVVDNQKYPVYAPVTGTFVGGVLTNISPDGMTIMNTTLPGHLLYDGAVTRSLSRGPDGTWYMTTHGVGNNKIFGMSEMNQMLGPDIFRNLDDQMRSNIEVHHGVGY